ncbi:MAG: glycosyltransferase [Flavobacteriales bacterium]|nr:glycosyltransferase [Flavobacteriales bacterium]MCX7767888.1 glycosyltransferase [Flavobacteriales bacterium]MDW8409292.1 glycosyltransferase [Flavobacteriales bacterium]
MKKRILIICNDFPPYNSVGAERPASWCRHADPDQFEIIVFTRKWKAQVRCLADYYENPPDAPEFSHYGTAKVFYCDFKPNLRDKLILKRTNKSFWVYLQKFLTSFYYWAPFFFSCTDSTRTIYLKAKEFLKKNLGSYSLIIATGEPFISFLYAYKLSKEFNIPWIADYRDGWSLNYGFKYMPFLQKIILKYLLRPLEIRLVKTSAAVTTVTEKLSYQLGELLNRPVHVIPNGYEPEDIEKLSPRALPFKDKFTIMYSGTLYPFQPLEEFVSFFIQFTKKYSIKEKDIRFVFVGSLHQKNRINRAFYSLNCELRITPRLPRHQSVRLIQKAHLLLFLASDSVDGSAVKIYDYMAVQRPVIVFRNDYGTIEKLIRENQCGLLIEKDQNAYEQLHYYYQNWILKNYEAFRTNPINIQSYSRKNLTNKMLTLAASYI